MSSKCEFEPNEGNCVASVCTVEQTPGFYEILFDPTNSAFSPPLRTAVHNMIPVLSRRGDTWLLEFKTRYEIENEDDILQEITVDETAHSGLQPVSPILLCSLYDQLNSIGDFSYWLSSPIRPDPSSP
jgi:hypothetical protein